MSLVLTSSCKVNLVLNILGKRPDGFHELETVMQPIPLHDELSFEANPVGLELTCSNPELPVDSGNLVWKAAALFYQTLGQAPSVKIHLQKRIPMAAGLGGGSGNAATTLRGLNELNGHPLELKQLDTMAAQLGSDVPFFLYDRPALATGRGEKVVPLDEFSALKGWWIVLLHPGFGVSTPWAYQNLARFPQALKGQPGRGQTLIEKLRTGNAIDGLAAMYNSLEAPVLDKYPVLQLIKERMIEHGAAASLMSGSGSTVFCWAADQTRAEAIALALHTEFTSAWVAAVQI